MKSLALPEPFILLSATIGPHAEFDIADSPWGILYNADIQLTVEVAEMALKLRRQELAL
jgi:hypothetical protein